MRKAAHLGGGGVSVPRWSRGGYWSENLVEAVCNSERYDADLLLPIQLLASPHSRQIGSSCAASSTGLCDGLGLESACSKKENEYGEVENGQCHVIGTYKRRPSTRIRHRASTHTPLSPLDPCHTNTVRLSGALSCLSVCGHWVVNFQFGDHTPRRLLYHALTPLARAELPTMQAIYRSFRPHQAWFRQPYIQVYLAVPSRTSNPTFLDLSCFSSASIFCSVIPTVTDVQS